MTPQAAFTISIQVAAAVAVVAWFFSAYWRVQAFRHRSSARGDDYRKKSNKAGAVFIGCWAIGFGGYWLAKWLGYHL